MQPDRSAAFCFNKPGLELRGLVSEPPPQHVALHIAIMAPESRDYNTIAGATVHFRFDRERDGVAEYREAEAAELEAAETAEVYVHAPMPAAMAKLLHDGKLAPAEVVAHILGIPPRGDARAPTTVDDGLHGLSDAPGG